MAAPSSGLAFFETAKAAFAGLMMPLESSGESANGCGSKVEPGFSTIGVIGAVTTGIGRVVEDPHPATTRATAGKSAQSDSVIQAEQPVLRVQSPAFAARVDTAGLGVNMVS